MTAIVQSIGNSCEKDRHPAHLLNVIRACLFRPVACARGFWFGAAMPVTPSLPAAGSFAR
jgi:hypothetical protein